MKKVSKTKYDPAKTVKYVKSEQKILSKTVSPFVLRLKTSFQTDKCFYMVTQFAEYGDLSKYLRHYSCFREDAVQILAAEILVALQHLHNNGIIYADLKPENVLIDQDGHVLLADFGLSWFEKEQENFQVTDEFMAPEQIQISGTHIGKPIDFWQFVT